MAVYLHRAKEKHIQKSLVRRAFTVILLTFVALGAIFVGLNVAMMPVLKSFGENRAASIANRAVYRAVTAIMSKDSSEYVNIICLQRDESGQIASLTANIALINKLKSDIANETLSLLSQESEAILKIPLGTVAGGSIFSGRGPYIPIRLVPFGTVDTEIEHQFTSAGINQTKHQIIMRVKAKMTILLPGGNAQATIETPVVIAETVIVGKVPENYTNVEDSSDDTIGDRLFNYAK